MNRLEDLGWSESHRTGLNEEDLAGCLPVRVVAEHRNLYRVVGERGEREAVLSGRLRHLSEEPEARPAVGDWVLVSWPETDGPAIVHAVLPRRSALRRKAAGRRSDAQVLAANLDTVFLVTSLNRDLNARRIERTLAVVWESGAEPVVLLSKLDLVSDPAARTAEVEAVAPGVPVVALSARTGEGLDALDPWLAPARTLALIGSSGVGKSTLVNRLAGEELLAVLEIREDDDRGRHATTHRQLVRLPGGALVIDTPGMREIGLLDDEDGVREAFSEIEAIGEGCRFRDCGHEDEPGCAVRKALEDGTLGADRFASLRKLEREIAARARREDPRARANVKKRWKSITLAMRKRNRAEGR